MVLSPLTGNLLVLPPRAVVILLIHLALRFIACILVEFPQLMMGAVLPCFANPTNKDAAVNQDACQRY